jgi:hypothetical protein
MQQNIEIYGNDGEEYKEWKKKSNKLDGRR